MITRILTLSTSDENVNFVNDYIGRESDSLQEALDHGLISRDIIETLVSDCKCQGSID